MQLTPNLFILIVCVSSSLWWGTVRCEPDALWDQLPSAKNGAMNANRQMSNAHNGGSFWTNMADTRPQPQADFEASMQNRRYDNANQNNRPSTILQRLTQLLKEKNSQPPQGNAKY